MKKILIISSFLMIMISCTMLGYKIVSANEKVDEIEEKIDSQKNQEKYLTPYGYTLENPNIIKNPYGDSPLSAMILFETSYQTKITIKIYSQDNTSFIENTYKEDTKHIIPIYGLAENNENKIEVITNKEKKTYSIKTEKVEKFNSFENIEVQSNKLNLVVDNSKLYGIDSNHNIIWYYKNKVEGSPYLLQNGNILLEINNNQRYSLIEIDLSGKIYKQINLESKIYDILEKKDSLYLLSNNLIELDWQTGQVLDKYSLKNNYTKIVELKDNSITIANETQETTINLKNKKESTSKKRNQITTKNISINYYKDNTNYKLINGVTFQNNNITPLSKKEILLVNYKKIDTKYKSYNINIKKTKETIVLTGNFKDSDESYIILDKFLDKRVYDVKSKTTIINQYGLSGKYSIYIKINNNIYKTNIYIDI
ncbi:MAG: aryl-sulfate sulfotransferase N-terminal domain-containing protein [Bacilli bacterium]|nr:aryl-sulfate sulfotransferase N-terminal domain-containing protein [Bacilli bacterium]